MTKFDRGRLNKQSVQTPFAGLGRDDNFCSAQCFIRISINYLIMRKIISFLFAIGLLTVTACEPKPKTEEAGVDSKAMMTTDTTTTADSASTNGAK